MKLKCGRIPFLLLIIFLYNSSYSFAASFSATDSSIHPRKPHKLNRQQFLNLYGTDDSSRALIRYYFPERRTAARIAAHSGASLALAGLVAGITFSTGNGIEGGMNDFFLFLFLLLIAYAAAPLLLVGVALLLGYSRRRLYHLLQDYKKGKGLPRRIIRKKTFLRRMKEEQEQNNYAN